MKKEHSVTKLQPNRTKVLLPKILFGVIILWEISLQPFLPPEGLIIMSWPGWNCGPQRSPQIPGPALSIACREGA